MAIPHLAMAERVIMEGKPSTKNSVYVSSTTTQLVVGTDAVYSGAASGVGLYVASNTAIGNTGCLFYSTGTANCSLFEGSGAGLTGITAASISGLSYWMLKADASTTTIANDLESETTRATTRENAIASSTGVNAGNISTLFTALSTTATVLSAEVARATSRENAIAVDTGTIVSSLSAKSSTGTCTLPYLMIAGASGAITCSQPSDVTGNAATVTNGVYTNGSYYDPAWLTALDGAKLFGSIASSSVVVNRSVSSSGIALSVTGDGRGGGNTAISVKSGNINDPIIYIKKPGTGEDVVSYWSGQGNANFGLLGSSVTVAWDRSYQAITHTFQVDGTIGATSYDGAGTGLTGTAASLSVGGSAGSVPASGIASGTAAIDISGNAVSASTVPAAGIQPGNLAQGVTAYHSLTADSATTAGTANFLATSATVTVSAPILGNGSNGAPLRVDDSSVTLKGNSFNGASQLVQLGADGKLTALDGSNLTNLPAPAGETNTYTSSKTFTSDIRAGRDFYVVGTSTHVGPVVVSTLTVQSGWQKAGTTVGSTVSGDTTHTAAGTCFSTHTITSIYGAQYEVALTGAVACDKACGTGYTDNYIAVMVNGVYTAEGAVVSVSNPCGGSYANIGLTVAVPRLAAGANSFCFAWQHQAGTCSLFKPTITVKEVH